MDEYILDRQDLDTPLVNNKSIQLNLGDLTMMYKRTNFQLGHTRVAKEFIYSVRRMSIFWIDKTWIHLW